VETFFKRNVLENHFLIAILAVVAGYLLWDLRSILASLFIAYIISTAMSPWVDFLAAKKINRTLSTFLVFFSVLAGFLLIILPLIPFAIKQISSFFQYFPQYLERIGSPLDITALLQSEIDILGKNAFSVTTKVFGGILSAVTTTVISFYLLLNRQDLHKALSTVLNRNLDSIDRKLGAWVRGQLLLCLIIGFFTWIGLTILGVPQAFPLAVIAGALEIVPTIGPIVSAIPAAIVAMTISPGLAMAVIGLYTLIQQAENHLIVPKVMQQVTGLNPIVVIVGILIGGNLMGVLGAILAIPVILVLTEIVQDRK